MMLKLRWLALPVMLSVAAASATTLVQQDVAALTKASALIVRGTVTAVETRWTKDGARIMTDATVAVAETWKGAPRPTVVVMQPGGVVGEVGQQVHGTARFRVGEEVVLFLEPRGTRYLLSGMVQGKFLVERSSDGAARFARQELEGEGLLVDPASHQPVPSVALTLPLDQLRAQVLAVAGATAPAEPSGPVRVTP